MTYLKKIILMAVLSIVAAGCDYSDNNRGPAGSTPPTANTYTVTVTSVVMVNKDSGEVQVIEGFPIDGGLLTVE